MAKRSSQTFDRPPFPPLTWGEYFWKGQAVLPFWRGFQTRQGPYTSVSCETPSDGTVKLYVATPDDKPAPPTPVQAAAFGYLLAQQKAVGDTVLQAIFDDYPRIREDFYDYPLELPADLCPEIEKREELRPLIGLATVHILPVARDGIAYVGFEFDCVWDEEAGLGVLTHTDRFIERGPAEKSYSTWFAEHDARKK